MKNKIIITVALALLTLSIPAFSKDNLFDNPGKNEIILVGKVSVKANEDMNFYAKTRKIKDEELSNKGCFAMPFVPEDIDDISDSAKDFIKENPDRILDAGEFFFIKCKVNKKTRNLRFVASSESKTSFQYDLDVPNFISYYFFSSARAKIHVPFDYNFDVPKDASAVYIGSFYFETKGKDFVISNAKKVDEYELAQEALNKVTKKHLNLYRVDLKPTVRKQ